ncbi:DUF1127 domain-containing protein [Pseudaestuariivita rosea]|uniref:DUF1127 domain-containing protein n=1 Tax=Pseudaestuariivita rosea TaxID=2763263 RepID=UPI001ABB5A6E|nr:DUF1127 domain-containing protein [Pseudaestuariivita rosea]
MAAIDTTHVPASRGFAKLFVTAFGGLAVWQDKRATRKTVSTLSSRELKDIGVVPTASDRFDAALAKHVIIGLKNI